ncbi:MAG: hypothetical protein KC620_03480, partial [Myxococcales bacterium]|nr:hypothetical protein [Myxococcales bacterium]
MRAEKLALIALVLLALVLALYRAAKGETAAQTAAQAREVLSREEGLIDALDALDRRVIAVAAEQAEAAARRREQAATLAEAEDRLGDVRGRVSAQRERLR